MRTLAFLTGILAGAIATETIHRYGPTAIRWAFSRGDTRTESGPGRVLPTLPGA